MVYSRDPQENHQHSEHTPCPAMLPVDSVVFHCVDKLFSVQTKLLLEAEELSAQGTSSGSMKIYFNSYIETIKCNFMDIKPFLRAFSNLS